jgi:hypothetical protein
VNDEVERRKERRKAYLKEYKQRPENKDRAREHERARYASDPEKVLTRKSDGRQKLSKDAARYRWLRENWGCVAGLNIDPNSLDATIDLAMDAASGEKS